MIAGVTMALAILLFGRLRACDAGAGRAADRGRLPHVEAGSVKMVWKTGLVQQVVMVITFVTALFVPLQFAVLIGAGLVVLLFVFQQSTGITVVAWATEPGRYPMCAAGRGSGAARHRLGAPWQPLMLPPVFA